MKKLLFTFALLCAYYNICISQVIVKPGTWPTMCQGGPFVTQLTPIVIKETNPNDFALSINKAYELLLPTGYQFNLPFNITYNSGGDIVQVGGGSQIGPLITVAVTNTIKIDSIVITGLQLRAVGGAVATGNIYRAASTFDSDAVQNGNMPSDNKIHGTVNCILNPVPTITYTPTFYYCNGENINYALTATPTGGTWSGSGVTGSNFNPFGLTASNHAVTYTKVNGGGCSNSSTINFNVLATPLTSLASNDVDNIICVGQSVIFTASSTGSNKRYQFYKNDIPFTVLTTTNSYTVSSISNGDKFYVISDNGNVTCTDTSNKITITVVTNPNPTVDVPDGNLYCNGTNSNYSVAYNSSAGQGALSGAGISGGNFNPFGVTAGNHIITHTVSISGCTFTATDNVFVNASPQVILTSSDADNIICEGDAVTFTANTSSTANRYLFLKNSNGTQGPNGSNAFFTSSLINGDNISVTVDNGANTCQTTSSVITTTVGKIPKSLFSWKNTCGQNQVTFHDLSSISGGNTLNKWEWDYTNDAIVDYTQTNSLPDVVFNFPATNTYQTTLRVTSNLGCFKDTTIRVFTLPGKTPTPIDPYTVNFAASNQGWAFDGNNSSWGWGSGPNTFGLGSRNIWSTGQSTGNSLYQTAEQSYLYGPCLNLTQLDKPMLAIKLSSKMLGKPAGAILEATTDDGLNWIKVGALYEGSNWYNDLGIISTPNTDLANTKPNNPDAQGWTGNINFDNSNLSRISLQPFAGNASVRLRINFESTSDIGAAKFAGIGIDSVWVGNRTMEVLIEHFTNNEVGNKFCQPIKCMVANDSINKIQSLRPLDAISIQYHTSFPAVDNFNSLDPATPSSRVLYYGVSQSPRTVLNGINHYIHYGQKGDSLDVVDIDSKTLVPSKFKMDLSVYTIGNSIQVASRLNYVDKVPLTDDVVLQWVIVEENKTDLSKNYKYVSRKMLPDAAGTYIDHNFSMNDQLEFVSSSWDFANGNISEMGVVAFVQNANTKEVLQAIYQKGTGTNGDPVIASNEDANFKINDIFIFPNPASDEFSVLLNSEIKSDYQWEMFDSIGSLSLSGIEKNINTFTINTSTLNSGIYFIRIQDKKGNKAQKKIIIAH